MGTKNVRGDVGGSSKVFVLDPQTNGYFPKSGNDYDEVVFSIVSGASVGNRFFDGSVYTGFAVRINGGWTAANLELQGSTTPTGAFFPIKDELGTQIEISGIVSGSFWYVFPVANAFPFPYFKVRSKNTASTADVLQGAQRDLIFLMKG